MLGIGEVDDIYGVTTFALVPTEIVVEGKLNIDLSGGTIRKVLERRGIVNGIEAGLIDLICT